MTETLRIDGSDGGGQLLRSALALASITGRDVRFESIRGDRPNPGLRPQHLAAVRLAGEICNAEVSDIEVGIDSLTFRPGPIEPGEYEIDVGTAGSITLLFDTVLPLALGSPGPISVTASGGTDVKWAPPLPYYRHVKLPLVRSWGLHATVDVDARGFYPEGGGGATLHLSPSDLQPLEATKRGDRTGGRVYSVESADLAERSVADRQATAAASRLATADIQTVELVSVTSETRSTGSSIMVRLDHEFPVGFDALGEPGTAAEDVGKEAATAAIEWERSGVGAVDPNMADQLLVPMALAGGRISIPDHTAHVATSIDLLETFGVTIRTASETEIVCDDTIDPTGRDR